MAKIVNVSYKTLQKHRIEFNGKLDVHSVPRRIVSNVVEQDFERSRMISSKNARVFFLTIVGQLN